MQIKLFSNIILKDLEGEVNEFLKLNSNRIKLRQISNSESSKFCTIMLVYEPRMDKEFENE